MLAKPTECSLDYPSAWKHDKAFLVVTAFDDLNAKPGIALDLAYYVSLVRAVDPRNFQRWKFAARRTERRAGSITILNRRRCHGGDQDQAEYVDDEVSLSTFDFFSPRRSHTGRRRQLTSRFGYQESPRLVLVRVLRQRERAGVTRRGPRQAHQFASTFDSTCRLSTTVGSHAA